jgi:hypothetical protein
MVKMPLRKEWVVEEPMLIHLTSSHHFLDPLLEVFPGATISIFDSFFFVFLLCSFINVITGFYMTSSQEVVEAAGEEGKGGEKM